MPVEDSELEKEFELEMEKEETEAPEDRELQEELELEMDKEETEAPEEKEVEGEEEYEELEEPGDREFEENEEKISYYTDRFFELTEREYESEFELDSEVDRLLYEMERDFFFKGLIKKVARGGKQLIKTGAKLAKTTVMQAVKGVTSLARGQLRGLLRAAIKSAIRSIPGVGIIAGPLLDPAVNALAGKLGFEVPQTGEKGKSAIRKAVRLSAAAYDNLARNLSRNASDPTEANRLANLSFQKAVDKVRKRAPSSSKKGYRVIKLRRGDRIKIIGV